MAGDVRLEQRDMDIVHLRRRASTRRLQQLLVHHDVTGGVDDEAAHVRVIADGEALLEEAPDRADRHVDADHADELAAVRAGHGQRATQRDHVAGAVRVQVRRRDRHALGKEPRAHVPVRVVRLVRLVHLDAREEDRHAVLERHVARRRDRAVLRGLPLRVDDAQRLCARDHHVLEERVGDLAGEHLFVLAQLGDGFLLSHVADRVAESVGAQIDDAFAAQRHGAEVIAQFRLVAEVDVAERHRDVLNVQLKRHVVVIGGDDAQR